MLERAVALARPRVNQRQVGDEARCCDGVFGKRLQIDRVPCLADCLFLSAKPSIKICGELEILFILDLGLPCRVQPFPCSCKHRQRFLLIATRTRNLSIRPALRRLPGVNIGELRRSSGNHPVRRVVIPQVKSCHESNLPYPFNRTKLERHLLQERLSRDWITFGQFELS